FSLSCARSLRDLHSFPTRRSSDLAPSERPVSRAISLVVTRANPLKRSSFSAASRIFCRVSLAMFPPLNVCEYSLTLRSIVGRKRSEEHTSELQSRGHLVCRLLLEK